MPSAEYPENQEENETPNHAKMSQNHTGIIFTGKKPNS
jgi:hypothetical protein